MSKKLVTMTEQAAMLRADIAERERELRESKTALDALEGKIQAGMMASGLTMLRCDAGSYSLAQSTVPKVADWRKVYDYIRENDAFDMVQKRISVTAWRERAEAGEAVPGVESEVVHKVAWRPTK